MLRLQSARSAQGFRQHRRQPINFLRCIVEMC
jgi:hypothetical protein